MSQKEDILELANKYGLDTTSGGSQLESLKSVAEALGMDHYNGLSNEDTDELQKRMREYDKQKEEASKTNDDSSGRSYNNGNNNFHNRLADRFNRGANGLRELSDKANNLTKNLDPNSRRAKAARGLNMMSNGVNKANNIVQGVNNKVNTAEDAVEDPLGTAADVAKDKIADKAKEKVGEVKDKAKDAVKEGAKVAKEAVWTAIKPFLPWIIGGFLILVVVFIVVYIIIILIGNFSDGDKNNVANISGECGFTISATSLSRDEFVRAVSGYKNLSSDFVNNAGAIYDKAVSMNLNPELVVVRAIAESGGNTTSAPYNYWGMGCTNEGGGQDCHSYSSFMDGVDEFLQNISKYDSLNSMMSNYSYLGDYWYNPGSGGQGGCYYANLIFDTVPARVKTACSGKKCDGSDCVKTTKEEQKAYTKWQVEKNMASIREKVFGLKFNEGISCNEENGNFTSLSSYILKHKGLKILSKTVGKEGRDNINNYINSQVKNAGYGTGVGVAAAGQSLTYALAKEGYYLGYCWGGDRSSVGFGKSWGLRSSSCNSPGKSHHYYGMDCSGFVSWSIRNGCKSNFGSDVARGFRDNYGRGISIKDAKPGDLMASGSHVRLIVKNNGSSIIVAEESGSADGLIFNEYKVAGSYKIVSMSNWYKKNCKK